MFSCAFFLLASPKQELWVLFFGTLPREILLQIAPPNSQCRAWRVEPQKQSIWLPQGLQKMSDSTQKVYKTQDIVVFSCVFFLVAQTNSLTPRRAIKIIKACNCALSTALHRHQDLCYLAERVQGYKKSSRLVIEPWTGLRKT